MSVANFRLDDGRYVAETRAGFQLVSYPATVPTEKQDAVFNWLLDHVQNFKTVEVVDVD